MSAPRIIIQIAIVGAQIFGKALMAAGKQAVQNAKHRPGGVMEEAAGVRNADAITQTHRMTLDEAHLILNAKKGDPVDVVIKNYEHLFKINSPPEAPTPSASSSSASASASSTPSSSGGRRPPPTTLRFHSHYLQSKIVRARERIEAELKILQEAEDAKRMGYTKPEAELPPSSESSRTPPPPPPS